MTPNLPVSFCFQLRIFELPASFSHKKKNILGRLMNHAILAAYLIFHLRLALGKTAKQVS